LYFLYISVILISELTIEYKICVNLTENAVFQCVTVRGQDFGEAQVNACRRGKTLGR